DDNGINVYPEDKIQANMYFPRIEIEASVSTGLRIGEYISAAGLRIIGVQQDGGCSGTANGAIGEDACITLEHAVFFKLNAEAPIINWVSPRTYTQEIELGS